MFRNDFPKKFNTVYHHWPAIFSVKLHLLVWLVSKKYIITRLVGRGLFIPENSDAVNVSIIK